MNPQTDPVAVTGDEAEFLDAAGAQNTLRRLCHAHALLSVRRSGHERQHLSVVLAVDAARGVVLIDALQPDPRPAVQTGETLRLRARLEGAEAIFSTTVAGNETWGGAAAIALHLPDSLRLRERRRAHRIAIPESQRRANASATTESGVVPMQLVDISVQGAGLSASRHAALNVGDTVRLNLELTGAQVLALAEIRSQSLRGELQRLGLLFTEMAARDQDRLAAAILCLERQLMRDRRLH